MKGKKNSGVDRSRNWCRRGHWSSDALDGHLDLHRCIGQGRDWGSCRQALKEHRAAAPQGETS